MASVNVREFIKRVENEMRWKVRRLKIPFVDLDLGGRLEVMLLDKLEFLTLFKFTLVHTLSISQGYTQKFLRVPNFFLFFISCFCN